MHCVCGKTASMASDEISNFWGNLLTPSPSAENSVVPCSGNNVILLPIFWDSCAQLVGGLGLARTGDIVELAFYGKECGLGDVLGADRLAAYEPVAIWERVLLEYHPDSIEIELSGEIEHRIVFVVKDAMIFSTFVIATNQLKVIVVMRGDVTTRIHCHEPCVL